MFNPWKTFEKMIAGAPEIIVTVKAHNTGGTSTVETLSGGQMVVRGQEVAVDSKAFVKDGEINREAPDLPYYEIEV